MKKVWIVVSKNAFTVLFSSSSRLEAEDEAKARNGYLLQVFEW